ncbi:MAG TPA: hypothetical protein VK993_08240, partial [Chthoniobacterales bacterium]|nr:hypothetical protein [Chthoniobacterales bacterium]
MTATNSAVPALSRWRRSGAGLVAGTIAGVVMTAMMLLLAAALGLATPLVLIGDRISVLLPVDAFLALMGKVGGYNRMKQLGVSSVIIGQIVVGAGGGVFYALALAHLSRTRQLLVTLGLFILLPLIVLTAALWPVLGTHFGGLPIRNASIVTLLGLLVCLVAFERTLVLSFSGLTRRPRSLPETTEFSPPIARRALILGGLGLLVTGGGAALLRRLYQAATFSYDGKQYRGADVQPITPNDQFYCVTKNVI